MAAQTSIHAHTAKIYLAQEQEMVAKSANLYQSLSATFFLFIESTIPHINQDDYF
jgi:hypothetical protein